MEKNFRMSQCKPELKFIKTDMQKGRYTQERVHVCAHVYVCFLEKSTSIFEVDIAFLGCSLVTSLRVPKRLFLSFLHF